MFRLSDASVQTSASLTRFFSSTPLRALSLARQQLGHRQNSTMNNLEQSPSVAWKVKKNIYISGSNSQRLVWTFCSCQISFTCAAHLKKKPNWFYSHEATRGWKGWKRKNVDAENFAFLPHLTRLLHWWTPEGTSWIRLAMKEKQLNILQTEHENRLPMSLEPVRITNLQPDQGSHLRWRMWRSLSVGLCLLEKGGERSGGR